MTHRISTEVDVDAVCDCGTDLLCPECDNESLTEDLPQIPTEHTQTLIHQLRGLYDSALDDGRYQDKELLSGLVSWLQT
jgi:hypothetical protein